MIEGGKTPFLSAKELEELGFKIVVFPLAGLFAATKAMEACFRHLKKQGTTAGFGDTISLKEFEELIEVPKYRKLEEKFTVSNQVLKKY